MRRLGVLISIAVLAGMTIPATVLAAAPGNDDIATPTVVGSIPYTDGPYDTTEATTGATDPSFCFGEPDRSTVWYSFTPAASGSYLADTFGSDYDTTLYVGTPDGSGGMDAIDCNDDAIGLQSALRWDAEAGTTYLLAVGTCCGGGSVGQAGGGGMLEFHIDIAPPAPTIDLTVAGPASFTSAGTAIIRGAIACTGDLQLVELYAGLRQRVGRLSIQGYGYTFMEGCAETPTAWSIEIFGDNGRFAGGPAQLEASAFGCTAVECTDSWVSRTVRLRR